MSRLRGLWQASLNATKKALTWNVEDWIPPTERYIFNFSSKEELKKWHLYSDSEYGGLSSASLEIKDNGDKSSGVFSGNLSLDVEEGTKWKITRSGFCGMRSKKIPLAHYLPTWRGNVIDAKLEMNPSRILGMSLSVNAEGGVPGAKSGPGDFRLEVDWIKALRTE
ncbi:hypothetical protein PTKIN_Ptkin18bG0082100 [Pterospermum kingtungense]